MKPEYREIRLKQLSRSLAAFEKSKTVTRPKRGWLRAVREALGLKLNDVGRIAKTTRQLILYYEKSESADRISLGSLRRIADAMDCELVYAIVPKSGTLAQLAERKARDEATQRVLSVEHSMALENQAVGRTKELIDSETKQVSKKRRS